MGCFYRQCALPWPFCVQIHNPQRLRRPSPPARPARESGNCRNRGIWILIHDPAPGGSGLYKMEPYLSLPSRSPSLARSPKGLLQYVINFTFPVCRRGERRLCPSSGPACPRGHQLKALIGQQYIKVAPGSGSSERQESISWAFVSKHRNTEE